MLSTPRRRFAVLFMLGAVSAALVFLSIYTVDRIGDCTTPGGECYSRQKTQREENIQRINQITVVTGWCSMTQARVIDRPQYETLRRCVDAKLAAVAGTEKGTP